MIAIARTADELHAVADRQAERTEILNENLYKEYRLRIQSRYEKYNDVGKFKHQVLHVLPDSPVKDTQLILKEIDFYLKNCI